jgi:hypothetical protein
MLFTDITKKMVFIDILVTYTDNYDLHRYIDNNDLCSCADNNDNLRYLGRLLNKSMHIYLFNNLQT